MRHFAISALVLCLILLRHAPRRADAADAGPDLGANAAMKYWEGFALLPPLNSDQERLLEDWQKAPLDGPALDLIKRSETSRLYLHRGAKLTRCDWSLDYDDGIRLVMPHVPKARTLARLTALHARHEFEQRHWQSGWDDVMALLKLARHIEKTPIMVGNLVGYSIEAIAIETASPWLQELKAILPKDAHAVTDSLPAGATLVELVEKEKQIGPQWLIRELKQAEQRQSGGWQAVWNEVLQVSANESKNLQRDDFRSIKTFEQAVKALEEILPLYDELAKIAALPWKEFDAQYQKFAAKSKAASPLAGVLLPAMGNYVASHQRYQARVALFKAAVAVVQDGPDKLQRMPDPFGDGPFEYRAVDNGFELKSKLVFREHAVTLTVGRPGNSR
jgi:hypothetical protein